MASAASILTSDEQGELVLRAEGEWLVASASELDRRLNDLKLPQGRQVTLDLGGLGRLDSTGALLLLRTEQALATRGNQVEFVNLPSR